MKNESSHGNELEEAVPSEGKLEAENYLRRLVQPRSEYKLGNQKLHFEYQFSDGSKFIAQENEHGVACTIERDGEIVVDFRDFSPGYTFITPHFIAENWKVLTDSTKGRESFFGIAGRWACDVKYKFISVGDMKDPQAIFSLLHEIGHSRENPSHFSKLVNFLKSKTTSRARLEVLSERERNAWARAIRIARELKERKNIDLLEVFQGFDELEKFMHGALYTYEIGAVRTLAGMEDPVYDFIFETSNKFLARRDIQFLKKNFDKGKLDRREIGEIKKSWNNENKD